jgi:glutathione S-transferase
VICQYLEDRYPQPALFPADIVARARARWLEEYADTRMAEVFIWRLFNQLAIRPSVWGEPADQDLVAKTMSEDIPHVLDYLETQLPPVGFAFGEISIADISIAAVLRNAAFVRFKVDPERWPLTAGFVDRVLATEPFRHLKVFEDTLIRTPIAEHRATLATMGAPLTSQTYGTVAPRRGVMNI